LADYLKKAVYSMARCFPVSPGNCGEATVVCRALREHGTASTIGKLSKSGDDPAQIVADYLAASDQHRCAVSPNDFYLSLKPPALQFSPQHVSAVVARAVENGQGVHFDAHGLDTAEGTFRLLKETIANFGETSGRGWSFGVTLPSRWKRSVADARWVVENGVRPRLVKGEFAGTAAEEVDPVLGYLELAEFLAGEVPEVAVATHDCALAREAVARCRKKGAAVQFELFFGLPFTGMMALAHELQVPLRFYVPYGEALLVFLIRDLLSHPRKMLRPDALELFSGQEKKLARIMALTAPPA
jgi:proline dehydrogenase